MSVSSRTAVPRRSLLISLLLAGTLVLINACGTAESTREANPESQTLRLTALDSTSRTPLDSATAVNRTFGDTLRINSAGQFVIEDVQPALHVFDVSGYGYHTRRHLSVLVEPDDTTFSTTTSLLPKRLTINCQDRRPYFWDKFVQGYREDTTKIQLKLTEVFAEDGEVRIQPVAVNDLSSPVFFPDNFGALGHYEVILYDGDDNRIPYTHKDAPADNGHRIYSRKEILPVVPKDVERMEPSVVVLDDSVEEGTTIYARLNYTFSNEDTLETTSATTFPDLNLDSLQTPVFDTLRTAGEVQVPDSLVVKRDTTIMRVVGIDTTVTRNGYTLYSTLRDGNSAPNAEAARNLLYVPDSVIARSRRDSLRAVAAADTTVPEIDTVTSLSSRDAPSVQFVDRTNETALRSILTDQSLIQGLSQGLPETQIPVDSLLSISPRLREPYFKTPSLPSDSIRQGLDLEPDSALADSILLSAPKSDPRFQLLDPDTADTARVRAPDNPFLFPSPTERLAADLDFVTLDSLRLTIPPGTDSVITRSAPANDLRTPPEHSYWYLPPSMSKQGNRTFVFDPSFLRLRARPHVDTTETVNLTGLLPDRLGQRTEDAVLRYPQLVARAPVGTYRSRYLTTWKSLQEDTLQQHYCDIFPFPLNSDWRSTVMR